MLEFYTCLFRRWMIYWASSDNRPAKASESAAYLVTHVHDLCLTLIQTSPITSTYGKILDFYYQTSFLASDAQLVTHTQATSVPPATLIYNLFFTASPITTSRVCSVVAKYKEGFQVAMSLADINYTPRHISEFNKFLMDICNCLWRQRALSIEDANANGCLVSRPVVEDLASYLTSLPSDHSLSLASLFSPSYSPVFSLYAVLCFRELEEEVEEQEGLDLRHDGPVSKTSLKTLGNRGGLVLSWDDYRRRVLGYLDKQGMSGIEHLLSITIGTLRQRQPTH